MKTKTPKSYEPKEYVWTLNINGQDKVWKCRVEDTQCITYEGDTERKHLKIMNPERSPKVIQIDTVTTVYGRQTPFRLRNGVPYLQLEGRWQMSETTFADRLDATVKMHRRNSAMEAVCGAGLILATVIKSLVTGDMGQWWMLVVFGVFFLVSSAMRMIRLKFELENLEEKKRARAAEKEATQAAQSTEETLSLDVQSTQEAPSPDAQA